MIFSAKGCVATRMCRAWYSVDGIFATSASYSAFSSIVGRLLAGEEFLRQRLLQDVEALHLHELRRVRLLVQTFLLRLMGDQLGADQIVECLGALLR